MAINFKDFGNKLRNVEERYKAQLHEEAIKPTATREEFFSSDVFSVGKSVLFENVLYEIIDKRSNYVVIINESGKELRKFPTQLVPSKNSVVFPEGTYKGIPIPEGYEKVMNESTISDRYGFIKSFELFSKRNFSKLFESAEKIGIDEAALLEAAKSEQLQAISIISGTLKISLTSTDPQKMVNELIKKSQQKNLTPQQKQIFTEMMSMLKHLGLSVTDVSESVTKFSSPKQEEQIQEQEEQKKRISFSDFRDKIRGAK